MELTDVESAHMIDTICENPELFFSVITRTNTTLSYKTKRDMIKQYASKFRIPTMFITVTSQALLYDIIDAIFESGITKNTIKNLCYTLRLNKQFVTQFTKQDMIEQLYELPNYTDKHLLIDLHTCITECKVNLYTELGFEKYSDEKLAEMLATNPRSTIKEALIAYEIESTIAYRAS